jgi:hypothetical protein
LLLLSLLPVSLVESSTSNSAFLSGRVSSAVDTIGANAVPASLGATTTGRGRGLAAFKAFAKQIICSHFFSSGRDFGAEGSSAVLVEVVAEAGDDSMTTLSPFVFSSWRTLTAVEGTLAQLRAVQKD